MRLRPLGAWAAGLLGACGATKPSTPPAPVPGSEPASVPAAPSGPLHYRLRGPVAYEVERYDSLFYASMPGAPQATAQRGVLSVRPVPGRNNDIEVRLDSLGGLEDARLTPATVDSSIGSRWQFALSPAGPRGPISGGHLTVLAGQIEAIIRLLFPQLPEAGLRSQGAWTDSTAYRVQVDAFDALETATRISQAVPSGQVPTGGPEVTVEANERLVRNGTGMQGGQVMTIRGTGLRRIRYQFAAEGWVGTLMARDSIDLVVTIGSGGETVPVHWHSTLIGRMRDVPVR